MAALFAISAPALAGPSGERERAIGLCRAAIATETGLKPVESVVDFQESRTTPHILALRFKVHGEDDVNWSATCEIQRAALVVKKVTHGAGAPLKYAKTNTN